MTVRQLDSPTVTVGSTDEPYLVTLLFKVPGSKFGPVLVRLERDEAHQLATELGWELQR